MVIISFDVDQNKGWALGASLVLEKPVSQHELQNSKNYLIKDNLLDLKGLAVLVVDDDPLTVEIIATRLVNMGILPLRAYGGAEAIEIARTEKPAMIMLDLMMPEVSGFDVVNTLQETPETANIPIIIVTAKIVTNEDRATLNGNIFKIIEKSEFNSKMYKREVQRALNDRR